MTQANILDQVRNAGNAIHHFHGGLRLRHNKKISCQYPIEKPPLPSRLYIPLLQHTGSEAVALVSVGQNVLKGQPIARFENPTLGFIHASTSGCVEAISAHPISHASGIEGLCIVLKSDGLDRWFELQPLDDWQNQDPAVLLDRIRKFGIVGLGGAVFPTSKKLDDAHQSHIHTLILNGAECEPYISCDEMLMREQPGAIVTGAVILQKAVQADQTIIAIEDQMGAVFEALQTAIDEAGCDSIRLIRVTTIYPEGGEKQLIQVLTGLEVPAGQRPTDLGMVCLNVATAAAINAAITQGKPLVERIVTVSGKGVMQPRNFMALIGTPISSLIELCGGYTDDAARLILGGPMMGYALASDQQPVVKAANCILVLTQKDIQPAQKEMPCIRCGECARVCPALLLPQTLQWQIRNERYDDAADYGLSECIECGCCDYVCPSHIPLVEWFRFGKSELHTLAAERSQAEIAQKRFESREARLASVKFEQAQRLEEKKSGLQDQAEKKRKIADALNRVQERSAQSHTDAQDPSDS